VIFAPRSNKIATSLVIALAALALAGCTSTLEVGSQRAKTVATGAAAGASTTTLTTCWSAATRR